MRTLWVAVLALSFLACTVEDGIPRRTDAGADAGSDAAADASKAGSAGSAGNGGSGEAGLDAATDVYDSSAGAAGSDSAAGAAGAPADDGGAEADAPGCVEGQVECAVAGAPPCWGAGTDCSTLTECKGSWAACAAQFTPHCGDVRGFACCPDNLPVFCDVSGPSFACWEQATDCSTITDCSGEWFACPAGQKYVCGQGCKGN